MNLKYLLASALVLASITAAGAQTMDQAAKEESSVVAKADEAKPTAKVKKHKAKKKHGEVKKHKAKKKHDEVKKHKAKKKHGEGRKHHHHDKVKPGKKAVVPASDANEKAKAMSAPALHPEVSLKVADANSVLHMDPANQAKD